MKKSFLFAIMAAAMMVSCGAEKSDKGGAEDESQVEESSATTSESGANDSDISVSAEGIVYVDLIYINQHSAIYATEGKALEQKLAEYQEKAVKKQASWQTKEQNLANEYSKLQKDAMKIQQDYEKGLITGITAQQKSEELAKTEQSIQSRINSYQSSVQKEGQELAKEEQALYEENMVFNNRFTLLVDLAVKSINADGRYKMIIDKAAVINADESLDISALVLAEVDKLYNEGALD